MGSEFQPPAKRLRSSPNVPAQLSRPVREFNSQKHLPSILSKMRHAKRNERTNKADEKIAIPKLVQNTDSPADNKGRTIKLKSQNGQVLGEINVKNLPSNIQGKTISILKKAVKKPQNGPIISNANIIGLLTPVSILQAEKIQCFQPDTKRILRDDDATNSINTDIKIVSPETMNGFRTDHVETKSEVIFKPAESWPKLQISNTIPNNTLIEGTNKYRKIVPQCKNNISPNRNFISRRISSSTQNLLIQKTYIQTKATVNCTDKKSPIFYANSIGNSKSNIEISKIPSSSDQEGKTIVQCNQFVNKSNKSQTDLCIEKELVKPVQVTILSTQTKTEGVKNTSVGSNNPGKCKKNVIPAVANANERNKSQGTKRKSRIIMKKHKSFETNSSNVHLGTSKKESIEKDTKDCHEQKHMKNNLIILEKALSSVEDEILRDKALKALANCGIGIEKLVPVHPPSELKSVKNSETQTSIFGLWEDVKFVSVSEDLPGLCRIQITERNSSPNVPSFSSFNSSIGHPNALDSNKDEAEVIKMIENHLQGNAEANSVAAIFEESCPLRREYVDRLEKDFHDCKNFDKNGMLGIHRAVIENNAQAVMRLLMVLQACGESPDVPTKHGQTSLELAAHRDVSLEIVKLLLDAGAEPTSAHTGDDSPLLIASKEQSSILMELISCVENHKFLDSFDSIGFAAIHYCAQNGFAKGLKALIDASADVNLCDLRSGRTPLFHSIENEHNSIVKILLENGADPTIPNFKGETVFNILDDNKHHVILELLTRAGKEKTLLDYDHILIDPDE